jgi:PPP family 3-phenylpropionic acid transporter
MNLTPVSAEQRRDLRLTRLYYLIFFGGSGFLSPFINLFFIHQGLSGAQVGSIASIFAFVTLLAAPFWTSRSIGWQNPRAALQLFVLLTALSYLFLSQQTVFWGIALFSVMRALVSAGISPLSDSLALTLTKASGAGYGSVRVWGSLGWVIFVPFSGWLIERTALVTSLLGAALLTATASLILFGISQEPFGGRRVSSARLTLREQLGKLRHNPAMIGLALMVIVIGIGSSGVLLFENVYLQQLGASNTLIGVIGTLSAVVELPCMLWADRLIARRGSYRILLLSLPLYFGLRVFVLLFPSIVAISLSRALAGFCFSFYTVALTRFIAEQSSPTETRTMLALYTVTITNLVSIVSAPLAGAAFDAFGARWLYLIAAIGYSCAWLTMFFTGRRYSELAPPLP